MKAVIVVGSHGAGKSKTINAYLKAMLGIGKRQHRFQLRAKLGAAYSQSREEAARQRGIILSQSREEAKRAKYLAQFVRKYSRFQLLVLAARPSDEDVSCLPELKRQLRDIGYSVHTVRVYRGETERFYKRCAREIVALLSS